MSQRKAKGSTGVKYKSKAQAKAEVAKKSSNPSNKIAPIIVIAVSVVVLIVAMAIQSSKNSSDSLTSSEVSTVNQNAPTLPPMTGVEVFDISQVSPAKAKVTTLKLDELAGTDCVNTIMAELKKCGTIGKVRADYSNQLLEVQCEAASVTDAEIIDALIKANHPGKVTAEKIAAK